METAVYDNPKSMCREAWRDGKLVSHISYAQLLVKGFTGHRNLFFPLNCGDWQTGKVRGDASAIDDANRP